MKLLAIALDYDGTIAKNNTLDDRVRVAIGELRAKNIVVQNAYCFVGFCRAGSIADTEKK